MRHTRAKKFLALLLAVVLLAGALPLGAGANVCYIPNDSYWAKGFDDCRNKGLSTFGWENNLWTSWWGQAAGHNCTNYVAYRLSQVGVSNFLGGGNADAWANYASNAGYSVNDTATPGSIAFWKGCHVAVVEEVNPTYLVISQDSWGGTFSWAFIGTDKPAYWPDSFIHIPALENNYGSAAVNLGDEFYADIINTASWLHASNEGNVVGRKNVGQSSLIWQFKRLSDGSYKITSIVDGKCLDAANWGTTDGTNIGVCTSNGSSAQQWVITGSSAQYQMHPKYTSNLCLDFTSGSNADGTNIQLWTRNNTVAQKLQIWKVSDASKISASVSGNKVSFSWTKDYRATIYNLRILKDGKSYKDVWNITKTAQTVELEPGIYQAYVDACNTLGFIQKSNNIQFTVTESTATAPSSEDTDDTSTSSDTTSDDTSTTDGSASEETEPTPVPVEPTRPTVGEFTDVFEDEYFADAVEWAVESGITSGTDKTHFGPNQSCTRAQAVTFLWRAAGKPEPAGTGKAFADVSADSYYAKAVQWAVEQGITSGTSETKFSPESTCTRAQIVTFLYRSENSPDTAGTGSFGDVPSGAYYEKAVVWAVENNITSGTGNGKFSPEKNCVRGQIVAFLYRSR